MGLTWHSFEVWNSWNSIIDTKETNVLSFPWVPEKDTDSIKKNSSFLSMPSSQLGRIFGNRSWLLNAILQISNWASQAWDKSLSSNTQNRHSCICLITEQYSKHLKRRTGNPQNSPFRRPEAAFQYSIPSSRRRRWSISSFRKIRPFLNFPEDLSSILVTISRRRCCFSDSFTLVSTAVMASLISDNALVRSSYSFVVTAKMKWCSMFRKATVRINSLPSGWVPIAKNGTGVL